MRANCACPKDSCALARGEMDMVGSYCYNMNTKLCSTRQCANAGSEQHGFLGKSWHVL